MERGASGRGAPSPDPNPTPPLSARGCDPFTPYLCKVGLLTLHHLLQVRLWCCGWRGGKGFTLVEEPVVELVVVARGHSPTRAMYCEGPCLAEASAPEATIASVPAARYRRMGAIEMGGAALQAGGR